MVFSYVPNSLDVIAPAFSLSAAIIMFGGYCALMGPSGFFSQTPVAIEYAKLNNVTFTVLLLSEFVIILLTVEKWHYFFIVSQVIFKQSLNHFAIRSCFFSPNSLV